MKNLKLCLILLVSCFIFSNCEQESIQTELVASTYEKIDLQTAKVTAVEQIHPEAVSRELESRDGRETIYEYEGTVHKNHWMQFYFEKKQLDPDCKYYAVLTPTHGNANLYIHARDHHGNWREIRYSRNEHTEIEETYGEYIDLKEHESFLYFNVYGVDQTSFKIEFYKLCDTDIHCNCPSLYQPVIGCDGKMYNNACAARCAGQYCNIQLEFITPIETEYNTRFKAGTDLFVKVDAKDDGVGIKEVKLYVNGEFVRSEYHTPYEWGKPHRDDDHLLNNLSAGGYELTAVAINEDGKQKPETITIGVR